MIDKRNIILTLTILLAAIAGAGAPKHEKDIMTNSSQNDGDVRVLLHTSLGDITILLYGDTPRHTANFVKRVNAGDYDGVLFHRVINDFMIQTGDPSSKNAPKGKMLGAGDSGEQIDAEFLFPKHYHHRGAIAAARQGDSVNPEKKSSGSQFYIVTGRKFSAAQMEQMEHKAQMQRKQNVFDRLCKENRDTIMTLRRNRDQAGLQTLQEKLVKETEQQTASDTVIYTPEMREVYANQGGTPHLDGEYTVYGRVIDGMDIVEKIEKADTDANDRPIEDIKIISAKVID